jgi:hypothetical protein
MLGSSTTSLYYIYESSLAIEGQVESPVLYSQSYGFPLSLVTIIYFLPGRQSIPFSSIALDLAYQSLQSKGLLHWW